MSGRKGVEEAWELATSDGRFKVSGPRRACETVTVTIYEPGSGHGPAETSSKEVSVQVNAEDWHELVDLVAERLAPAAPRREPGRGRYFRPSPTDENRCLTCSGDVIAAHINGVCQ